MVTKFTRADRSLIGIWWWTVDRWVFMLTMIILMIGVIFSFASTPMVAVKIGLPEFYFVKRHLAYTLLGIFIIIAVSLLEVKSIRRLGVVVFLSCTLLMGLTFFLGIETKGARRWINFGLFAMQPSEFIKPAFSIFSAWMLSEGTINYNFPGVQISLGFYAFLSFLLVLQPDMGMVFVLSAIFLGQLFLMGIPFALVFLLCFGGGLGGIGLYWLFPHFATRINKFIDPAAGDCYQINRSLEAFQNGGWFGVGPGEGIVKKYLPDAHADFVFSVIAEEFGALVCIFILAIYFVVVFKVLISVLKSRDTFVSFALFGLITQFSMQVVINISSCLHLIPTKGMTLPFISYGGSSMLALSLCMGMILGLSRKRPMILE